MDNLIIDGNLGFYSSCEVTTVFIENKKTKKLYNYFSIFYFDDKKIDTYNEPEYITEKLQKINKMYSFGIIKYRISIPQAIQIYQQLKLNKGTCNLGEGDLITGNLYSMKKQFIPADSTTIVPINKVLKNNYFSGSYILEFFDTEKSCVSEFANSINGKILDLIPIDLKIISDRIGNLIFQFPSQIMSVNFSPNNEENELTFEIAIDERISLEKIYQLIFEYNEDNSILGFAINDFSTEKKITIKNIACSGLNNIKIIDRNTNLIIYNCETSFIRSISMNFNISSDRGIRTIGDDKK